jgi:hypothetical protein
MIINPIVERKCYKVSGSYEVVRRIFGLKREEVTGGWRNHIMRRFIICTFQQYYHGDKIKEDEVGGACSAHWKDIYVKNCT